MKHLIYVFACLVALLPNIVWAQDRAAITADFRSWLEQDIWPKAAAAGVSRATFETALSGVNLNWTLPDLVIPGASEQRAQTQAEFRPPSGYFAGGVVNNAVQVGAQMSARYAASLAQIEQQTGVPGQILLAIWGRESSFGRAAIPHDAFEILSTKGFMSTRAAYFSDELIAALRIVEGGFATRDQMKSSWAGALGQPQFMPSNYLAYAVDGDGDGRADIWRSERDTLASIAAYLRAHGWKPGRDWGFEVSVPANVSCALEGIDNGRPIHEWASMGVTRVSGRDFPSPELDEDGYLMMPAGRYGPAFIVTSNFYVLKAYNESDVYALFVGHVGDRIKYGGRAFRRDWDRLDDLSRGRITQLQQRLEGLGFDVGGADGLIGHRTRRSIGQWQARDNRPQTCYPSREISR